MPDLTTIAVFSGAVAAVATAVGAVVRPMFRYLTVRAQLGFAKRWDNRHPDAPPDTVVRLVRLVQATPQLELPPVLARASPAQIGQAS